MPIQETELHKPILYCLAQDPRKIFRIDEIDEFLRDWFKNRLDREDLRELDGRSDVTLSWADISIFVGS